MRIYLYFANDMIEAIIILIVIYLVFRFLTTYLIPVMTQKNIKRYQEKFKKENPDIFKKKDDSIAEKKEQNKEITH